MINEEVILDDVSADDHHSRHSTLREQIVEHVFIAEFLRRFWQRGIYDVEILRSEFDGGGYDVCMSRGRVTRHIQLKSVGITGKAARVSVNLRLADKQSGCVIWLVVTDDLMIDHYLWFGGEPGQNLPDLSRFSITKHTKGNKDGVKLERPSHRVIPRGEFTRLDSLDGVLTKLFGALP